MKSETVHESILQISDIAKAVGVSLRMVRFYEESGLLKPYATTQSGLRLYNNKDVIRLRFINTLRRLDISLDDIKTILGVNSSSAGTKAEVLNRSLSAFTLAQQKIDDYQEILNELRKNNSIALESVQNCLKCDASSCKDCPQSVYIFS
ncbi:MerR family transcriptional regulator, Zn(II)-responsive regulator of zntA [Dehalogenimonas formicexedens]|uniref:MerR family transcriptional regulator, Zn(II)-responsive regulator of zntA n=2 Tax=Dehalogenimonas TaxID=670486 RepID=A0A1P8FA50_9CHLR|nr:MerR family transcriptional regulator, Zn(II)-responsive regulator of zntA [Dehalogenimonas formicexedens]KTB49126.1 putative transcriptional regulator [Dehalogenimonas alkenigignens]